MNYTSKLEHGIALIREAFAEAHEAAKADIIAKISGAVSAPAVAAADDRKRAPKGQARALVRGFLGMRQAARFDEILRALNSDGTPVANNTLRKELQRGKSEGEYISNNGLYSLSKI